MDGVYAVINKEGKILEVRKIPDSYFFNVGEDIPFIKGKINKFPDLPGEVSYISLNTENEEKIKRAKRKGKCVTIRPTSPFFSAEPYKIFVDTPSD